MDQLKTYSFNQWENRLDETVQQQILQELESGHILHFPQLSMSLNDEEHQLLTPAHLSPKRKNISWDARTQTLRGCEEIPVQTKKNLSNLLDRYAHLTKTLFNDLFPPYSSHLVCARTSFRPGAINQRVLSPRKDDRLLHVDAFPSTPLRNQRLLRIFTNINPHGEPRIWRTSGPFSMIAQQFLPQLKSPFPGSSYLLKALRVTRTKRSQYDHYMLQLHDAMKENTTYQQTTPFQEIAFPAGSSWIVCTDQVAHAALSGQYMLEQSFYLPVAAMRDPSQAPQHVLGQLLNKNLLSS